MVRAKLLSDYFQDDKMKSITEFNRLERKKIKKMQLKEFRS